MCQPPLSHTSCSQRVSDYSRVILACVACAACDIRSGRRMGLAERAELYVGHRLHVIPIYGWGWSRGVAGRDESTSIDVPQPFGMRLAWLWDFAGERRGGVGQVEHPGHECDRQWVLFLTRHEGELDFDRRPGHYNVSLAPVEPIRMSNGWPQYVTTWLASKLRTSTTRRRILAACGSRNSRLRCEDLPALTCD